MRRGQTEMVGVVVIAVFLIFGVLLYARFATNDGSAVARDSLQQQEAKSFLIALLTADIPRCGVDVEELARACLEDSYAGACANPCRELQVAMETAAGYGPSLVGWRYNLSLEGTDVSIVEDCTSADRKTLLVAAPRQEIIGSGGVPLGHGLALAVCR